MMRVRIVAMAFLLVAGVAVAEPPRGRHERIDNFYSHALNNHRNIHIYLPPGYDPGGGERYPVVYMHDGQNLFADWESSAPGGKGWHVAEAVEHAVANGWMRRAIVVAVPNMGANRLWEYTPTHGGRGGGGADRYLDFLVNELKPDIDRRYATRSGREATAIVGSSLGGVVSLYAGLKRAHVFGLVGALSPASSWDNELLTRLVRGANRAEDRSLRLYLDSGDREYHGDDDKAPTSRLADAYRQVWQGNLRHHVEAGAGHNEVAWSRRIGAALSFLLPPVQ